MDLEELKQDTLKMKNDILRPTAEGEMGRVLEVVDMAEYTGE